MVGALSKFYSWILNVQNLTIEQYGNLSTWLMKVSVSIVKSHSLCRFGSGSKDDHSPHAIYDLNVSMD